MWRFDHSDESLFRKNQRRVVDLLRQVEEKVPYIHSLEIGENFSTSPVAFDLILITTHNDKKELERYRTDPDHKRIAGKINELTKERIVVDFEF
jgi:hypothetical protein